MIGQDRTMIGNGNTPSSGSIDYLIGEIIAFQVVRIFNNKTYLLSDVVEFPFVTADFATELAAGKWIEILTPPPFDGKNYVQKNGIWIEAQKRQQIIQFAFVGGGYGANSNWWRLNAGTGSSKYSITFNQTPVVSDTNAFAGDQTYPFHEHLLFDAKIKEVIVDGLNNGVAWNCDLAIRSYLLSSSYNAGTGSGVNNSQIVARETISIGANPLTSNKLLPANISTNVLPKYTCLRPYFKSQGVANSNWQNGIITILVEEA